MGFLWGVIAFLLILWIVGLALDIFGPLIHLVIAVAAILFVIGMFTGRNRV
jgi:hypothetical protein